MDERNFDIWFNHERMETTEERLFRNRNKNERKACKEQTVPSAMKDNLQFHAWIAWIPFYLKPSLVNPLSIESIEHVISFPKRIKHINTQKSRTTQFHLPDQDMTK